MIEKLLRVVLVLFLAILLYMQADSLYVAPVPDSIRWYGDESWLMTEAVATVETGKLHHPSALSSTLSEPKSILYISVPWLRTLVYGVPAYIAFPDANPVDVGRTVSFAFGLILLCVVALVVRRLTHSLTVGLCAVLLLIASRTFFFASHSARYDLLIGLIVLLIALWAASEKFRTASHHKRWFWLSVVSLVLAIGLPVHLYFYLAAIGFVAFVYYGAWKESQSWIAAIAGIAVATGIALLIQLVMTGHVSLWSSTQHQAEINDVIRDIPLFRLFSLSAQLAVIVRNAQIVWAEAPWLFVAIPLVFWSVVRRSRRTSLAIFALTTVIVWYFFERPHPAYLMHMAPLVLVAAMVFVGALRKAWTGYAVAIAAIVLTVVSGVWIWHAKNNGSRWTHASERALRDISSMIDRSGEKPLVLVEASANKVLLTDTTLRLMTTHFQFFPDRKEEIIMTLKKHDVDYVILYNSLRYGYDRNQIDPLVKTVQENGDLVATKQGRFFDIGRNYGQLILKEVSSDTFFLYRMR